MPARSFALLLLASAPAFAFDAPFVRTSADFEPVTAARIEALPAGEREPWLRYLKQSERLAAADLAALAEEKTRAVALSPSPSDARPQRLELNRPAEWYESEEAATLAERVISYQTPAGGWNKSNPYTRVRAPGEEYGREQRYRGTFDNNATTTELRWIARVASAHPGADGQWARDAFARGVRYILQAQYPHGGWPQVYPLTGGYHDAVTFNDDAIVNLMEFLREVASGEASYAFVPSELRTEALRGRARGVGCILATQTYVDGRRAGWGQQHDALTLRPCAARNYEMASLSSAESAGIVRHLLSEPNPTPAILSSIAGAIAWFERTAINDVAYRNTDGTARRLVAAPGEGPLWPRMMDLVTSQPLFGDRDLSVHSTLDTVSEERRRGYAWYTNRPASVIAEYTRWQQRRTRAASAK